MGLKAVEVGNIFNLGTKFSDPYLKFKNDKGEDQLVYMGSYGIGPARLMGTIAELLSDEKGLVWPKEVAPFRVHLIALGQNVQSLALDTYEKLVKAGVEVLYDDRDVRAGEKFADADLIGIPTRVVVGSASAKASADKEKDVESKMLEVKDRNSEEVRMLSLEELLTELEK